MQKTLIKQLIDKNGRNTELIICMEECSELIKEISKCIRSSSGDIYAGCRKANVSHLLEEMADVTICIQILQTAFDISDEDLKNIAQTKEDRLRFRYCLK